MGEEAGLEALQVVPQIVKTRKELRNESRLLLMIEGKRILEYSRKQN